MKSNGNRFIGLEYVGGQISVAFKGAAIYLALLLPIMQQLLHLFLKISPPTTTKLCSIWMLIEANIVSRHVHFEWSKWSFLQMKNSKWHREWAEMYKNQLF